jgi:hypothetical protein
MQDDGLFDYVVPPMPQLHREPYTDGLVSPNQKSVIKKETPQTFRLRSLGVAN